MIHDEARALMSVDGLAYLALLALLLGVARLPVRSVVLRQSLLVAASYAFYATWSRELLVVLLASTLFNHAWGRVVRRRGSGSALGAGVATNAVLLLFFKSGWTAIEVAGISFFTFQAISALVDARQDRGERPTLLEFALYMAFWPTILSGPICRLPEMLPQYRALAPPAGGDVRTGARRILIGLFQKLVVAETLARGIGPEGGVASFWGASIGAAGPLEWGTVAVGLGLWIYFDFCGYSNIVIGSARMFGLRLRENFSRPFLATSPAEFWTRWHMSLSSWIRDYVFFPLAAAGRTRLWSYAALIVSMVTFGLWHGLEWHFLLWGLYQGGVLALHRLTAAGWKRLPPVAGGVLTLALISAGWPLFAATGGAAPAEAAVTVAGSMPALVGATLALCLAFEWAGRRLAAAPGDSAWRRRIWLARPAAYATMALWIVVWGEQTSPFVYIRF